MVLTASYVAVGYAMRRFGALERADGEVMLRFVVNVTLPAMLLHHDDVGKVVAPAHIDQLRELGAAPVDPLRVGEN